MIDLLESLKAWIAGWLGGRSSVAGEGLETTLEHTWPWPPWITLLALIAVTATVLSVYLRESPARRARVLLLCCIRCVLVGLVIFMMYGWRREQHRTDLPEVVIAVDASASMSLVDEHRDSDLQRAAERYAGDSPTRLELARALLSPEGSPWLAELRSRYRLKLFRIGAATQHLTTDADQIAIAAAELEAADQASRLGRGLREILDLQRGRSTAAIVMLTDGITTEGPAISEAAAEARRRSIPLFVVGIGSSQPPSDVRIGNLSVDDFAFVEDVLNFDFQLHSHGFAGREAVVRLINQADGATLAEQTVEIPGDGQALPVRLSHRPRQEGEFEFTIEVQPFAEEVDPENNRITRPVTVRDATIRVLLVQSGPSYEFRFLRNLLSRALQRSRAAAAIDLTTVLQEADVDFAAADPSVTTIFPVQQEDLFEHDVLIFGDADPALLSRSDLANVAAFVRERGGGVVFIAGPRHMPHGFRGTAIENLFPFDLETAAVPVAGAIVDDEFRVRPTPLGREHPILQIGDSDQDTQQVWSQLPALRWMLAAPDVNTTAMVLAEHPGRQSLSGDNLPVLLLQFVGAGKVICQTTDETWLWARYRGDDTYYARYWLQMIRYLGRSKLAADRVPADLTTDAPQYLSGETVQLRVLFRDSRLLPASDDGVSVMLEDEPAQRTTVTLTRDANNRALFAGSVTDLRPGAYRARLAAPVLQQPPPARHFVVVSRGSEQATVQMNAADLIKAADVSGGRFYTVDSASRLPRQLPAGTQVRVESLPPEPIWNSSWLAALFVALIATEWIIRKRVGLL